jgi:vanillate O-demethylase monooxygenase subunit
VPSYPILEQDGAVWIWMGDPAAATSSRVPRFPRHSSPDWHWRGEHFGYSANYGLLYDNLLDLTHVGYIHPNTIGGNEEEHSNAEMEVQRGDGFAKGVRWMRDVDPPAAYQALRPFTGRIDRCQVMRFQPGLVTISIIAHDAGRLADDEDAMDGYESHGFHAITPQSETRCHYFWAVGVPTRFMKPGLLEKKIELTRITFEEDREILEAQQRNLKEFPGLPVVSIRSDSLSMAARRIWAAVSAAEQTHAQSLVQIASSPSALAT